MKDELIFIYNADSGRINAILDSVHKSVSPNSYPCQLCAVTYGPISIRDEWKEYLDSLDYPKTFLHKNEVGDKLGELEIQFPVILLKHNEEYRVIVSSKEFERISDSYELISLMSQKIDG
jgi:hypothetical protein